MLILFCPRFFSSFRTFDFVSFYETRQTPCFLRQSKTDLKPQSHAFMFCTAEDTHALIECRRAGACFFKFNPLPSPLHLLKQRGVCVSCEEGCTYAYTYTSTDGDGLSTLEGKEQLCKPRLPLKQWEGDGEGRSNHVTTGEGELNFASPCIRSFLFHREFC